MPEDAAPEARSLQVTMPARPRPWVTYALIGITVAIWLVQIGTNYFWGTDWPAYFGLKLNEFIRAGQVWRLFTPMFLHDDHLPFHLLTNMYFFYIIGSEVERLYGHWRYLTLYLLAGITGNALSFALSPAGAWGASTALFGIMAANGVFILQNKHWLKDWKRAIQGVLMTLGINIFLGLGIGADNWGHIGGVLGGVAFAWLAGPRWELEEYAPGYGRVRDERGTREWLDGAALAFAVFLFISVAGFFWGVPGFEVQFMK